MSTTQYRLLQIVESDLPEYRYLNAEDECYYFGDYYPTRGKPKYGKGLTSEILNFKKGLEKKGTPEWPYKEPALQKFASLLKGIQFPPNRNVHIVPAPPSKCKNDPLYDDRVVRLLTTAYSGRDKIMVVDLFYQEQSYGAAHKENSRPSPQERMQRYKVDETKAIARPDLYCIFDDVLTTGSSFRAMKDILVLVSPGIPVIGIFLAKTIHQDKSEILLDFPDLSNT